MNQKYLNFKFEELSLMENETYVGRIVRWEIKEDVKNGDCLNIWVELYIAEGTCFLYSSRISSKVNSWFYYLCRDLFLLEEDGVVNFEILNSDCDIICELKQKPDGDLAVSNIKWIDKEFIE